MRIGIAQLNPTVGDIYGNLIKIKDTLKMLEKEKADLVVFSELFLVGYPPRDLLEKRWFIEKVQKAIKELIVLSEQYPDTGLLLGVPLRVQQGCDKGLARLYNSALLIHKGQIIFQQNKSLLPSYDVFDEARYFAPAADIDIVPFKGEVLGVSICEDAWNDPKMEIGQDYSFDPIEILVQKGATVLINISASPFQVGKEEVRYNIISSHAKNKHLPFLYVNQVGGNDELLFDGRSMCFDKKGNPIRILPPFIEKVEVLDIDVLGKEKDYKPQEPIASIHDALVMGIRDYYWKSGFKKAIIGLSGGIDSAVVCVLAVAALGKENVLGVTMPSHYSSVGSVEDSRKLAQNLGVEFKSIPIERIFNSYIASLKSHLVGTEEDVTEENLQARIRGNILMALSNKYNALVLTTGNKSELAVGYCTLYGDMCGGLSAISDLPKTMVYDLARFINREGEIIPESTIIKPPSAELKPGQVDQDTLPPYEVLDQIVKLYIDEGYSIKEIVARGFEPETVNWIVRTVDRSEYKRKQAAPGLKVTSKAFGTGRRMPIAAKYTQD